MSGQNADGVDFCYDIPRLLQRFESLGENCDFGVVQRAAGIEPFGLFRFAACTAADLALLLRSRFEPLGEPEDLWLDEIGPQREYCIKSRRFSFEAHTETYADQENAEVVQAAQMRKIRFLKGQLLRDLSGARKIFVFKGDADAPTMQVAASYLQDYGPNCLLWVSVSDAAHPPGSVECISTALLRGYVSHFGTYDGDPSLPVADWIAVCANAYRQWRHAEPPVAPLQNLVSQAVAKMACRWLADSAAVTYRTGRQSPTQSDVLEHKLLTAKPSQVYRVNMPIDAGGSFVFSAWIRIPETFRGRRIGAVLHGFSTIAEWAADVKSRRGWQRIWVRANLPADARKIACGIVADGEINDMFQSTSWCLERGARPSGYGFVL